MSKLNLEVTIEDAFRIGQLEGQRKILTHIIETFEDVNGIDKQFLIQYCNFKLKMLSEMKEYLSCSSEGLVVS